MAIFVDSADIGEVKRAMELGFVHGVTTNPILIAHTGKEAHQVLAELSEICPGPIFHQVAAGSTEEMLAEAKAFSARLPQRLVIKVPCTLEGLRLVSQIGETYDFISLRCGMTYRKEGCSEVNETQLR